MHHSDAIAIIDAARNGRQRHLNFVSPVTATMIAAVTCQGDAAKRIRFEGDAERYAKNYGLLDVIDGSYKAPVPNRGLQGVTYSKLTRLATHMEVENCNAVVNDLIDGQLSGFSPRIVYLLTKVVGELHDNVASHAHGSGFSAAQVYCDSSSRRVEFSIADAGCGMLQNVRRIKPEISLDSEAIHWCMGRGHTTAFPADFMAQRLPEDAYLNPYPPDVPTIRVQDHHVGEGLWKLSELISIANGCLWIASGNGIFRTEFGRSISEESTFHWRGVAIEFQIVVPSGGQPSPTQERNLDDLARRLGL